MARESKVKKVERTAQIISKLKEVYPNAHCALVHSNPLELLVATILSAQCTDERVNIVTKDLFKKYKTARDYANASEKEMEESIKSINFFRNKAKSIRAMAQILVDKHKSMVPRSMEELVELPGVGRKTANVVLGNAFNLPFGVVVDTHVARLSQRLGLTRQKTAEGIEKELMGLMPREEWTEFSHLLIWHGRSVCKARKPQCVFCDLVSLCPQKGVVPG